MIVLISALGLYWRIQAGWEEMNQKMDVCKETSYLLLKENVGDMMVL